MNERLIEQVRQIIEAHDQAKPISSNRYADGGIEPLWPRLERAAVNQVIEDSPTVSRYAIWANTVRDNILEALRLQQSGDDDGARALLVRAVNSLSAFGAIQALFDEG